MAANDKRLNSFVTNLSRPLYVDILLYVAVGIVWFVFTRLLLETLDVGAGAAPIQPLGQVLLALLSIIALLVIIARNLYASVEKHRRESGGARLAAIVDSSDDAIISRGLDRRILSWNPAAERLFGYTAREAIGQDVDILIPRELYGEVERNRALIAQGGQVKTYDTVRLSKDGRRIDVSLTISPINQGGKRVAHSLIVRDITERKRAEQRIERLTRFYDALSETNEAIIRITDRQKLFERVCAIAVEKGRLAAAWIGLVDWDAQRIATVGTAGPEVSYVAGASERINASRLSQNSPTVHALRENKACILNDYSELENAPWRLHAEAHGIRATAIIPLTQESRVAGCFNLYARESGFFDAELVQLLREIGENLSFALDNFVREEDRQRAEQQVRESETRYRLLIQHFPDGIVLLFDRDMRYQIADGKGFARLGIEPAACLGKSAREVLPAQLCNVLELYYRRALAGRTAEFELNACNRHWAVQVLPVREASGDIIGGLMVGQDLTDKKHAEDQLRLTGEAFESIADAVMITDAKPRILYVNKAFAAITGYTAAEVTGTHPTVLEERRENTAFHEAMWQELRTAGHWQGEVWDRRKNGELYPALFRISAVKGDAGTVMNYVVSFNDISQYKQYEARLHHLAHHDGLTGLPNRSLLSDRVAVAMVQARRRERVLALLFVDLDRFKLINDSLGHAVGDKLLKSVADRLRGCVRASDTVSRHGGDEFLVLLPEITHLEDAARVAEKIMHELAKPYLIEHHELVTSASIGIAVFPDNGNDMGQLLRNADAAMYSAKQLGRNRFQFYSASMNARAIERLHLEHDLRYAVDRGELYLVYQPQIAIASGKIVGIEALVRWRHPVFESIAPDRFITLAEESGLILRIGEWVLREACRQRRKWQTLPSNVPVSVNVSAIQFRQASFPKMVADALSEADLTPHSLELEVTESVLMQGAQEVIHKLSDLNRQGLTLAIDDFGTGYSSLSYLRNLPIHRLKIDRSFVSDLPANNDAAAITLAIVNMGRTLGLEVIAEGVETAAQAEFLQSASCESAQGYLYCRPVLAEEFEKWLQERTTASVTGRATIGL